MIAARWDTDNPVEVSFCGYKWDIVGINDGTNNVGLGTTTDDNLPTGNIALLLDKSNTIVGTSIFNLVDQDSYNGSVLQTLINDTLYNSLSSCEGRADITDRNLIDVSAVSQHLWTLSVTEAEQLTSEEMKFSASYWLRTKGNRGNRGGSSVRGSAINRDSNLDDLLQSRPALFLNLSSDVFAGYPNLDPLTYPVQFDLNSGNSSMADITMTEDKPARLPQYTGTKPNYRFIGWDTAPAATTVVYKDGAIIDTNLTTTWGDTQTLYAVWQAVDATTTNYYNHIAANWNTDNPTTIEYCGYKWNVVGINSGTGKKVGIGTAGDTANDGTGLPAGNVTLLLDKSNTIVGTNTFKPNIPGIEIDNYYNGSNLQTVIDGIYTGFSCSEKADITPRTLAGESSNSDVAGYNDDHIGGAIAENQKLWPLSVSEARQFSTDDQRIFPSSPSFWWLRTPGFNSNSVARVSESGFLDPDGRSVYTNYYAIRPALYLSLSSAAIAPNIDYKPYYIHFDAKQGGTAPGDQTVSYGKPANLTSYSGEKYGYTFEGWNSNTTCALDATIASAPGGAWASNNCDTTQYAQGATVTNLSTINGSTVSLYAVWKEKVTNITTDPTETSITYGQTGRLDYTITTQPTLDGVTWSSSNDAIASVNGTGLVTGVAVGDATITVKSTTNTLKYATTTVHIVPQPETAPTLSIDWANETVTGFNTAATGFKVAPSDTGLTTCNQLSAAAYDISSIIASSSKTLWAKKCATDTNHSESTTTSIAIPARPVAPVITTPAGVISDVTSNMEYNTTGANFVGSWTAIAGTTIPGLTNGTYYIRDKAVTTGGSEHFKSSAATVVLEIPVSGVTVTPTNPTITYGETSQLTETVSPNDAYVQTVTWSSSNTNVATVNSSGLVTSVSAGDATITAKSTSNQTKFGTTTVTVDKKPLTVSIGSIVILDRPYIAGTITAPVTGVVTIDSGIVNSDAITVSSCSGNYADDTVDTNKSASLTCTLSGTKASSYTITSYPAANGTILDYTEVDLGGHELEVPTDAAVTPESSPGAGDGYVTLPTTDPEYEVIVDDTTVIVPGGSVIKQDGTIVVPPSSPQSVTLPPAPTTVVPGNSVVNPADGTITVPDGTVIANGVSVAVPANSVVDIATGIITLPNGKVAVTQTNGSERLALSSATITQGKTLTITGSGFTPNELVRLELHTPTKVLSASVTVNASGKFTLTKAVTTATAAGTYQVVAYDKTSNIQLRSANLKVVKPAPPKPVSAKVKKAKGAITFIWGSSGLLTIVEIYYRIKGTSKWKIVRVSSADRKKIKLKRKKTYQFQLRSYKAVNGKNYYSAWTKKTVKL